jgi:hypothetical protein
MAKNIKSADWYKIQSQGLSLTATSSGSGGTSVAEVQDNLIKVKITTATDAKRNTATITTPFSFEIIGTQVACATLGVSGGAGEQEIGIRNGTGVIASNIHLATVDVVKPQTDLDRTYTHFTKGDDDLVVTLSGTSMGTVVAVLQFVYA